MGLKMTKNLDSLPFDQSELLPELDESIKFPE